MPKYTIIFTVVVLQGCATSASDPSFTHKPVSAERIISLPRITIPATASTVRVLRDSQFKGSAMGTTLTFNGQEVAEIQNGEKLTFTVDSGEHLLGLRFLGNDPVLGLFTLGLARPKRFVESPTRFEPGKEYIFRIVDNANWEWELKRSSQ